jgi:hypothetical protein
MASHRYQLIAEDCISKLSFFDSKSEDDNKESSLKITFRKIHIYLHTILY